MKKYLSFAAAIVAMLSTVASVGCSDDKTEGATGPVIEVEPTLTVSAEGGQSHLTYSITNPVAGEQITATCDQDWIYSFDYSTEGQIGFKYAAYADEENDRTANLTLNYSGADPVTVKVTQIRKGGMTFDITVTDVTENSAKVTVVPSNNDQTYMYAVVSASYLDSFKDSDAFIQDDVTYWENYCDEKGFSFESFMDIMLRTGEYVDEGLNDLDSNKDYYAYAYGLTREGLVTSGLSKAFFTTTKIEYTNVNFVVTYTNNDAYNAAITIRPETEDGSLYEGGWMFAARNSYARTVMGESDEEYQESILSNLKQQVAEGMFTQESLYHGELTFNLSEAMGSVRVWGGNTYYIYCFGLNENFNVDTNDGVFTRGEVKTKEIEVTNSCTFDVEVTEIEDMEAKVNVTPSDDNTTYFVGLTPTHTIGLAGGGDDALGESLVVERLLQRIDLDWGVVDWSSESWVERGAISKYLREDLTWIIEPKQELSVLVFGFNQFGRRVTEIARADFKALATPEAKPGFSVDIEVTENDPANPGVLGVKFTPKADEGSGLDANKVWYYTGLVPAYQWDAYDDWQAYIKDMEHSFGSLDTETVRGPQDLVAEVNYDLEYVVFALAYQNGITYPDQDPDILRVKSAALPMSETADLTMEVRRYSGSELEAAYPVEWKGASESGDYIAILLPNPNEAAVTWYYLLHASRQNMELPDGLLYKYFMTDYIGYRGGKYGSYSPGGSGPWGLFYTARDITGAWGPLHYEDVILDNIELSDPMTVPTTGKGLWLPEYYGPRPSYPDDPNPGLENQSASMSSVQTHTVILSTPVRFSTASFMLADSEKARFQEIKAREAAVKTNSGSEHSVADVEGFEMARINVLK